MTDKNPQGYYVYIHIRKSDGVVFYVGKGKGRRAWHKSKLDRNIWWHRINKKHGCHVKIIKDNMQEECAFSLEAILIDIYLSRGVALTNLTNPRGDFKIKEYSIPDRIKISRQSGGKPVVNSDGFEFETAIFACEWLKNKGVRNPTPAHIHECCKGMSNSAYKYTWWYKVDDKKEYISRFYRQGKSQMKPILCSNGMKFPSIKDAVNWLISNGCHTASQPNITSCCRGRQLTAYGHTWKYIDE